MNVMQDRMCYVIELTRVHCQWRDRGHCLPAGQSVIHQLHSSTEPGPPSNDLHWLLGGAESPGWEDEEQHWVHYSTLYRAWQHDIHVACLKKSEKRAASGGAQTHHTQLSRLTAPPTMLYM